MYCVIFQVSSDFLSLKFAVVMAKKKNILLKSKPKKSSREPMGDCQRELNQPLVLSPQAGGSGTYGWDRPLPLNARLNQVTSILECSFIDRLIY